MTDSTLDLPACEALSIDQSHIKRGNVDVESKKSTYSPLSLALSEDEALSKDIDGASHDSRTCAPSKTSICVGVFVAVSAFILAALFLPQALFDAFLDVVCATSWAFTEISPIPATLAARRRKHLAEGENPWPWVQNLVASLGRAPYYYNPNTVLPFTVKLLCCFAVCCSSFTGLTALRLTADSLNDQLSVVIWLGLLIPTCLSWFGSREAQGIYFVAALAVSRLSMLAKIPHAIRTRDGTHFSDSLLVWFNFLNAILWSYYALRIGDLYILANSVLCICCVLPCILLKLALHPSLLGKSASRERTEEGASGI